MANVLIAHSLPPTGPEGLFNVREVTRGRLSESALYQPGLSVFWGGVRVRGVLRKEDRNQQARLGARPCSSQPAEPLPL